MKKQEAQSHIDSFRQWGPKKIDRTNTKSVSKGNLISTKSFRQSFSEEF